jgi:hypothetical protein
MPAGMHHAWRFAGIGGARLLVDGQRVHVGAQPNRTARATPLDHSHYASGGKAGDDLVHAEFAQLVLHHAAGAEFLQGQLGVAM